jgi:hypothetical protein
MPPITPSRYALPTINCLVGNEAAPFNVHYHFLADTRFFEVHGEISNAHASPTRPAASPTPSERTVNHDGIKVEEDVPEPVTPVPAPNATTMSVYQLKGHVFDPAAFEIVINSLYNCPPEIPRCRAELRTLRKTYILALMYGMENLQNDVVDCFRRFHSQYNVLFEDFVWFVRWIDADEHVLSGIPMVQYLISQCAYEIAKNGYAEFAEGNNDFEEFLVDGAHPLRKEIFKAIAALTNAARAVDPATGMNKWRVGDWMQDQRPEREASVQSEVIDLDD